MTAVNWVASLYYEDWGRLQHAGTPPRSTSREAAELRGGSTRRLTLAQRWGWRR